jgi:cytochrome P450
VHRIALPDGRPVWMVEGYDAARSLMADGRLSNDTTAMGPAAPLAALPAEIREVVAGDMLNTDPPRHTRLRQAVAYAFTARRSEELRPAVERIAHGLADGLEQAGGHGPVDLVERYAVPLPTLVLAELIGIPAEDCVQVRAWSETFVTELLGASESLLAATAALQDYARDLAHSKRSGTAEDLIGRLIASGLDDEGVASTVFMLLIAGQTATTQLIAKGLRLLLGEPDRLAALRADHGLIPAAVDEFLRYDPPLTVSGFRMTREPLAVDGTDIPAGEIVLCSLTAVNRDPRRFPEPDRLDLGRRDNQHLAFGHGIHRCLGANLAKVEAEAAVGVLLSRFRGIEPTVALDELPQTQRAIMRTLDALPVRLTAL